MNINNNFVLSVIALSALAQLSLISEVDWFQFTRVDIDAGQWWRFLTGNFVHLTWRHFALNALALVVIYTLYSNCLKLNGMVFVFLLNCLSVTMGIWIFSPELQWYVGLSGALHGLLITLIIIDYVKNKHVLNIILLLVVMTKLAWEGMMGPMPGSVSIAGGPVAVQAHLYGSIGGLLISTCIYIFSKNKML